MGPLDTVAEPMVLAQRSKAASVYEAGVEPAALGPA